MSLVRILITHRTPGVGGRAVVVVVDPDVRRVLQADVRRKPLVVRERLVNVRVVARDRRPQHGAALDGGHRHVEVMEARAASLLRRGEVHEEGVDARALRCEQPRVLVVMDLARAAARMSHGCGAREGERGNGEPRVEM